MSKPTRVKGKFKSIFGRKSSGINNGSVEENDELEFIFAKDVLAEVSRDNSIVHRARALKELGEIVVQKQIEEHGIEALLHAVDDLIDVSAQIEGRQAALRFIVCMTSSQYDHLGILRSQIFRIIVNHTVEEDLALRVSLLKVLTDNGKDISYCEQIGLFLVHFMSEALYSSNSDEFLQLLVNMVHYNSSFLDKAIIAALVLQTCQFCDHTDEAENIEGCLSLLDASVRYGGLPSEGIYPLIGTLCRTVNIEKFCSPSWKLMRNLIGTNLGHTAIYVMCQILENIHNLGDTVLLRGAVFFIGMSIWGSMRVTSLYYDPIHVLPSFKICLQGDNLLVAHEISLSLQRLVRKFGADQEIITWDVILDIIEALLKLVEHSHEAKTNSLYSNVHSILTNMEQLYTDNRYRGCTRRLFKILSSCARDRPENSVSTLLGYYQEKINPSNNDWLDVFQMVLEKYFRLESRTAIRVKVINMIACIFSMYRHKYEDDILTLTLNKYLHDIASEKDCEVRLVASQLLSDMLLTCCASNYPDVLAVMESLLSSINTANEEERENLQDIEITVDALIKAFKEKLFVTNNNYVVNIFIILFNHVNHHYIHGITGSAAGIIRKRIFTLLLSVRANEHHYIGIIDSEEHVRYSVHVIFKPLMPQEEVLDFMKVWLVDCDFQKAFDTILKCLKNELDWIVLECVLKHLKWQLQNKDLFVYCQCNMNKLCSALCVLVNDKMYLNKVQNCPASMGISELRNLIFPILSLIATYHTYLARDRQFELVNCIEFGLNTHCAHTCVSCLNVCILEMQHVMVRTLPSVLVKLSQISATVQLAIPVLQFLSTLKEIPALYVNFIEEQYMSIFAMALSYTDSYRYSTYIVTLAHQVISDWFTRCRLPYRKGFVTLIAKALKSSVLINVDREKGKSNESNDETKTFHEEMTDVCIDMMARYSFSAHIKPPKRSPTMEYLLSGGTSMNWLVGNMLITITTCSSIPGHCSACFLETEDSSNVEDSNINNERQSLFVTKKMNTNDVLQKNAESKTDEEKSFCSYEYIISGESDLAFEAKPDQEHDKSPHCRERRDSAALVSKLTERLAHPDTDLRMISPSETLLFSRQGSKSQGAYNAVDDEGDEEDDDESEEEREKEYDIDSACICDDLGEERENTDDYSNEAIQNIDTHVEEKDEDHSELKEVNTANGVATAASMNSEDVIDPPASSTFKQSCKKNPSYGNCKCACVGWAEVYIRRPTGNVSWIMKIENSQNDNLSAFPNLSMWASSVNYLELYKNLACHSNHSSRSESRRSLVRRNSTGSMAHCILQMADDSTRRSRDSYLAQNSLFDARKEVSNTSLVNGHTKLNSSARSMFNSQVHLANSPSAECGDSKNQVPMYFSSETSELQHRNCINPSFIFLQLFYSTFDLNGSRPVALENNEVIERATKILDRIPSFNTHKFSVIYVGKGQEDCETTILSNLYGSTRYADFISGLGDLVKLTECNSVDVYTGGLDNRGSDGNFAYVWKDETTQVIFHIATLMPNKENDNQFISKKRHIGNNFVTVIYDESKRGYAFGTVKGQFNSAEILIRPLEYNSNMVTVRYKEKSFSIDTQPHMISDCNLPILVRQLAIHTNMAVVAELREKKNTSASTFAYNWLERLRQIKRIKSKAMADVSPKDSSLSYDFTKFT